MSLAETAIYRYKTIIGRRLRTRILPNQRTEAKIGYNVLEPDDDARHAEPSGGSADTRGDGADATSDLFMHRDATAPHTKVLAIPSCNGNSVPSPNV